MLNLQFASHKHVLEPIKIPLIYLALDYVYCPFLHVRLRKQKQICPRYELVSITAIVRINTSSALAAIAIRNILNSSSLGGYISLTILVLT